MWLLFKKIKLCHCLLWKAWKSDYNCMQLWRWLFCLVDQTHFCLRNGGPKGLKCIFLQTFGPPFDTSLKNYKTTTDPNLCFNWPYNFSSLSSLVFLSLSISLISLSLSLSVSPVSLVPSSVSHHRLRRCYRLRPPSADLSRKPISPPPLSSLVPSLSVYVRTTSHKSSLRILCVYFFDRLCYPPQDVNGKRVWKIERLAPDCEIHEYTHCSAICDVNFHHDK